MIESFANASSKCINIFSLTIFGSFLFWLIGFDMFQFLFLRQGFTI